MSPYRRCLFALATLPFTVPALSALSQVKATTPPIAQNAKTLSSKQINLRQQAPKLQVNAKAWVLMSYESGQVLAGDNIHKHLPPASLAKLMSSYVISHAVENGQVSLKDKTTVSTKAWKTGGSKMFIRQGEKISIEDLMKGMIVVSGNDATVALAEHIAGDVPTFTHMMNQAAEQLGLRNTHFVNPNGLPGKGQYTSAYDLALLARNLISHYPDEYTWYQQKAFTWDNIKQRNRNKLLWTNESVDGLKTGYTAAAKYGYVVSAKEEDGTRLIAVILGAPSAKARAEGASSMLRYGSRFFDTKVLYPAKQTMRNVPLADGTAPTVPIGLEHALALTLNPNDFDQLKLSLTLKPDITAPIKAGTSVGYIKVKLGDKVLANPQVITLTSIKRGNLWQRISHWGHNLMHPTTGKALPEERS